MIETIISFISLILILVLAYFSTRYFAKSVKGLQRTQSMHIVESMMLERDKRILIVKIQNRYLALVTHQNGVENLGECEGYIENILPEAPLNPFETILNQWVQRKGDKHDTQD
jgi:flagellar biogenesis protein FliO